MDPVEEFREVAGRFGATAHGVPVNGWDAPTPVEGWVARDVVRHLVEWFPGFLAGGSEVSLPPVGSVDDDPVGTWDAFAASVQDLLDDPATAGRAFSNPHTGDLPLPDAISRFFTADVFLHTWDLARSTGQDDTLDAERCRVMLEGMAPYDELLRSSGQYGPRVPVAYDADPQTRLLGFIGRDPSWRP